MHIRPKEVLATLRPAKSLAEDYHAADDELPGGCDLPVDSVPRPGVLGLLMMQDSLLPRVMLSLPQARPVEVLAILWSVEARSLLIAMFVQAVTISKGSMLPLATRFLEYRPREVLAILLCAQARGILLKMTSQLMMVSQDLMISQASLLLGQMFLGITRAARPDLGMLLESLRPLLTVMQPRPELANQVLAISQGSTISQATLLGQAQLGLMKGARPELGMLPEPLGPILMMMHVLRPSPEEVLAILLQVQGQMVQATPLHEHSPDGVLAILRVAQPRGF